MSKQEIQLPYYELPENAGKFTAGTVAAKQLDALGFRFYWASEGLTEKDLAYKPNDETKTVHNTIQHIHDLVLIVLYSTLKKLNTREKKEMAFNDLRVQTLFNIKQAAEILRTSNDISQYQIIFKDKVTPYWNNINGPISDCIWHCGQLASFRRLTGNPINANINHFSGKVLNN